MLALGEEALSLEIFTDERVPRGNEDSEDCIGTRPERPWVDIRSKPDIHWNREFFVLHVSVYEHRETQRICLSYYRNSDEDGRFVPATSEAIHTLHLSFKTCSWETKAAFR